MTLTLGLFTRILVSLGYRIVASRFFFLFTLLGLFIYSLKWTLGKMKLTVKMDTRLQVGNWYSYWRVLSLKRYSLVHNQDGSSLFVWKIGSRILTPSIHLYMCFPFLYISSGSHSGIIHRNLVPGITFTRPNYCNRKCK